jgi:hypothetical protein
MKYFAALIVSIAITTTVNAAATPLVRIKELRPRAGGFIHVVAEGQSDMDITNCGRNDFLGMLLNFGDSTGTEAGKKAMFAILLTAYAQGTPVILGSNGCDSQYPSYSRLDYIDFP